MSKKSEKADLEKLEKFNKEYKKWDGEEIDPYDRDNGFEIDKNANLSEEPGVYMFDSDKSGPYYIGKANKSLKGRLSGKLSGDMKDKRVKKSRNKKDGKLNHEYPYLPIYDEESSKVKTLKTKDMKPSEAERIIIAAQIVANGEQTKGNRTGTPSFAKNKDPRSKEVLNEIADNFKLKKQK
jgi:hypothetical protein